MDHVDFAQRLLTRAEATSPSHYQEMVRALSHGAFSGGYSSPSGEPPPRYVSLRGRANDVANELAIGSPERRFFEFLSTQAALRIEESLRADEDFLDHHS